MLTRKQAKTKECPYFLIGRAINYLCTAEECPKWVDRDIDRILCPQLTSCEKVGKEHLFITPQEYIEHCNHCEQLFGRCGG